MIGIAAAAILWAWMLLTVRYNYGGQWTALYWIGRATPQIPPVAREHPYLWQTPGYDGQVFHVMAHDPWMRYGPPEEHQIAPQRYVRILVPMLAWIGALGQDRWIDPAYYSVIVAFGFLGAYWTARWAVAHGSSAAWGLVFLAAPAAIASADRMLCDIALAALCAGFLLYADGSRWKLVAVLAAAALVRETGAILAVAFGAWALASRKWRDFIFAAAALLPLIGWEFFVRAHSMGSTEPPPVLGWIPLEGFFHRVVHPFLYALAPMWRGLVAASDYVALAAVVAALAMAVRLAMRREWSPAAVALYGYALAMIFLRGRGEWDEVYSFGRLLTPLLLLAGLIYLPRIGWVAFAPMIVTGARVWVWLWKQAAGIWHGIAA